MKKEEEGFFLRLADKVSFGMGTPLNIGVWLLAVFVWFLLGLLNEKLFTTSNFLPDWFVSTAWNFPLNTITTLAELYIGFLVAAAANRSERVLKAIIDKIEETVLYLKKVDENQLTILKNQEKLSKKIISLEEQILRREEKKKIE